MYGEPNRNKGVEERGKEEKKGKRRGKEGKNAKIIF